ncbi:MAG: hypothetical protein FWD34_07680 [Oscillospiraceae bacterium]|nr:hypothetical protein [Oscillospiraceae bacterium]
MFKGRINILSLIMLFAGTVIIGSALSALYLMLAPIFKDWNINLGILLAVLFGAVMAVAMWIMVKLLKDYHPKLTFAFTSLGCLVFTYFKWGLYVSADAEVSLISCLINPFALIDRIILINAEGRWMHNSAVYKENLLWVVWAAEFLIICVPAVIVAVKTASRPKPFINTDTSIPYYNASFIPGTPISNDANPNSEGMGFAGEYKPAVAVPEYERPSVPEQVPVASLSEEDSVFDAVDLFVPDVNPDEIFSDMYDPNVEIGLELPKAKEEKDVSFEDLLL